MQFIFYVLSYVISCERCIIKMDNCTVFLSPTLQYLVPGKSMLCQGKWEMLNHRGTWSGITG